MTDVMKYQIVSAVFFQIILCLIIIHGVYLFRMGMDTIYTDYLYWIYQCAESACPVFWKSPVRKEEIMVSDR